MWVAVSENIIELTALRGARKEELEQETESFREV